MSQRNSSMQIVIPALADILAVYWRPSETSQHSYMSNPKTRAVYDIDFRLILSH